MSSPSKVTHTLSTMFSGVSNPNPLRLRLSPPPPLQSSPASFPSPTSPNIRSPRPPPLTATATATAYTSSDTTCFSPPTAAISPPLSLYEILGISIGANGNEIKTAYRQLARVSHPDVKKSSAEEFIKIHAAYSTLSDPEKRADYDRRLFRNRRSRTYSGVRAAPSYNRSNSYSGRNWETDQCW